VSRRDAPLSALHAAADPEALVRDVEADLLGHSEQVRNAADTRRYLLIRRWLPGGPVMTAVLLNPSDATEKQGDPTLGRVIGFARREGCHALAILNLFSLRSPQPAALRAHPDPVGAHNDQMIAEHCLPGRLVVAGWGVHGSLNGRAGHVLQMLTGRGVALRCLGLTKGGHPRHPLYVRGDQALIPYGGHAR
jgi:hypothetical protein